VALLLAMTVGDWAASARPAAWFHWWDKYLGDGLYAVACYLGLGLILGRGRLRIKLGLTLLYVSAIEVFQLSGIPLRLIQSDSSLVRLFARACLGRPSAGGICWPTPLASP
jgi:hypothetical protein